MIFIAAAIVLTAASLIVSRKFSWEFFVRAVFYFSVFLVAYLSKNVFSRGQTETFPPILLVEGNNSNLFWENENVFRDRFGGRIYFLAGDTFYEAGDPDKNLQGEVTDRALLELYLLKGVQRGKIFCLCEKISLGGFAHDAFLKAQQVFFLVQKMKRTYVSIVGGPSIVLPGDTSCFSISLVNAGEACLETLWVRQDGIAVESFQIEMKTNEHKNFEYNIYGLENGNHRLAFLTSTSEDFFDFSVNAEILPAVIYADAPDWEVGAIRRLLSKKSELQLSVFVQGQGEEAFFFDGTEERTVNSGFNPENYSLVVWISEKNPFDSEYRWRQECVVLWVQKTSAEIEESPIEEVFQTDMGKEHELTKTLDCEGMLAENFTKPYPGTNALLSCRSGAVLSVGSRQGAALITVAHRCFSGWYFSGGEARDFAENFLENTVSWAIGRRGKTVRISLSKRFFSTDEAVNFWVYSLEKPEVRLDGSEIQYAAEEREKFYFFLPEIEAGSHIITASEGDLSDTASFRVQDWTTPESFCLAAVNARVWELDSFLNFGQNIENTIIDGRKEIFVQDFFPAAIFICAAAVVVWFLEEKRKRS
ncbi:hypothetical protein JXA84_05535 [candidate division WOR-3 bacterium]|nr:hypothetical protein [candidate division WOR-3 bacterium]